MATVITQRLLTRRILFIRPKYFSQVISARQIPFKLNGQSLKSSSNLCACNELLRSVENKCYFSTNPNDKQSIETPEPKLTIFQRFKQMYRDYWYVLVPVHLATSACWLGGFYYLAKSGIDVVAILESWNFSERITNPLKDSSMGYIAISYALYKIATPIRYTVTLGGTTLSINYLKKWGYIKPVPSRDKLKEMYIEKKESLIYNMKDKSDELKMKGEHIKDQLSKIKDTKGRPVLNDLQKEVKKCLKKLAEQKKKQK